MVFPPYSVIYIITFLNKRAPKAAQQSAGLFTHAWLNPYLSYNLKICHELLPLTFTFKFWGISSSLSLRKSSGVWFTFLYQPSHHLHITFTLPSRYLHVTIMLPSCYLHVTFMLPSCNVFHSYTHPPQLHVTDWTVMTRRKQTCGVLLSYSGRWWPDRSPMLAYHRCSLESRWRSV